MNTGTVLKQQPILLWRFLGFFQPPPMRLLHGIIALLVIVQLLDSLGISIHKNGQIGPGTLTFLLSWLHMGLGLVLLILALFLSWMSLSAKGLRHFFPYLWGDVEQIVADIKASLRLELVGPRSRGLAAAVQGLGLGALLLTLISGASWLAFRLADMPDWAATARAAHKNLAPLLFIYLMGHGSMALLHFVSWQRKVIWQKHTGGE